MHVILHARLLGHQMHVIRMLRGRRMRDQDLSIPQPALPRWHRWHWCKPGAPRLARRLSRGHEEAEALALFFKKALLRVSPSFSFFVSARQADISQTFSRHFPYNWRISS